VRWLTLSDAWIGHGGTVALFGGLKLEADLLSLIPWMRARNLKPAFFAIEENYTLVPYLVYREEDFVPGVLGVLEPRRDPETRLAVEDIGTVLVPGRAFATSDGTRLGLGKGHYDRFLSAPGFRARKIGVGFALQMEPTVPGEAHDMKMDALVSETGWMAIGKPDLAAPAMPASGLPDDASAEAMQDFLLRLF
jgi:5-formyltetrahydrofolate cyclo-ligase